MCLVKNVSALMSVDGENCLIWDTMKTVSRVQLNEMKYITGEFM